MWCKFGYVAPEISRQRLEVHCADPTPYTPNQVLRRAGGRDARTKAISRISLARTLGRQEGGTIGRDAVLLQPINSLNFVVSCPRISYPSSRVLLIHCGHVLEVDLFLAGGVALISRTADRGCETENFPGVALVTRVPRS